MKMRVKLIRDPSLHPQAIASGLRQAAMMVTYTAAKRFQADVRKTLTGARTGKTWKQFGDYEPAAKEGAESGDGAEAPAEQTGTLKKNIEIDSPDSLRHVVFISGNTDRGEDQQKVAEKLEYGGIDKYSKKGLNEEYFLKPRPFWWKSFDRSALAFLMHTKFKEELRKLYGKALEP